MASCSDAQYVNNGDILLYPKGFTMLGYERTIANMNIWIGYAKHHPVHRGRHCHRHLLHRGCRLRPLPGRTFRATASS